MGRLHIVLSDEIERELRDVIGYRKGALSKFIEEAVKEKLREIKNK